MLLYLLKVLEERLVRLDVINLEKLELVDSAEVGKQAGGIAFWKIAD